MVDAAEDRIAKILGGSHSSTVLRRAAQHAAKRERLHCPDFISRGMQRNQCQLWAYHEGYCDDTLEPGDPRSSFPPEG